MKEATGEKEVTVKEKLDDYKMRLQKLAVGVGMVAAGGVGVPILGNIMYDSPEAIAYFQHYSMISLPITGLVAAYMGIRLKGYFDLKKEVELEEQEEKGMKL